MSAKREAIVVAQKVVTAPVYGRYAYSVTVPGTAVISIIAGKDHDNDGRICHAGEDCGAYPMLSGRLKVLRPAGDLGGIQAPQPAST